jgi:TPR repeat protein
MFLTVLPVAMAQQSTDSLFAAASKGDKAALAQLRSRANQNDSKAQWWLGMIYEEGRCLPKDVAQALTWYTKAADNGYAKAATYLGALYGAGDVVPKNDSLSWIWWERSADLGDEKAQLWVGKLYALRGLKELGDELVANQHNGASGNDLVAAYKWFNLAAAQGNKEAAYQRDNTAGQMTPAQIADAQRLSAEWKRKK